MNLKNMVRKVAAVGAGATMVGATLMGALATSLADYPAPFVSDGAFDAVLIVGDNAAAADIIGVTDIAMALQFSMKTTEEVETTTGTTTVSGGVVEDELALGFSFAGDTYDDGDITVLEDDEIRYDGEDYDYEEQLFIGTAALNPASAEDNEDFEGTPRLIVTDGTEQLCYRYVFDSAVPFTNGTDMEIEFLGTDLTITKLELNSATLSTASETWLNYGESVTYAEFEISVGSIYDTEAMLTVNGVTEVVADGAQEDFDFDDFEVEVLDVLNDDGTENDAVKIKYGATTSETADNGAAAEMLGYGDDDDEAEWVWDVSSTSVNVTHVGVCYNQDRDQIESELDEDYELAVLSEGDTLSFPYGYATLEYATTRFDDTYQTITVEYDNQLTFSDDDAGAVGISAAAVWVFDGEDGEEPFTWGGNTYEKWIVLDVPVMHNNSHWNTTVCYEDANGNKDCESVLTGENTATLTGLDIVVDDDVLDTILTWETNHTVNGNVTTASNLATITISDVAGATAIDTWANDIVMNATSNDGESDDNNELTVGGTDLTNVEEDFLTDYGIVVKSPEGNTESGDYGKFVFAIPDEELTIDISFAAESATVSTSSVTTESVVQIEVGATRLASEAGDVTAQNAIVVGGPCANAAAGVLMGNPSPCYAGFTEGEAMVKLYENGGNTALLVAGATADDTRTAAKLVANGGITSVDGMEAVVTTLTESVTAPTAAVEEPAAEETTE